MKKPSSCSAQVQFDRTGEIIVADCNRQRKQAAQENTMDIPATESFGSRSSIRSLKGTVTGTGTAPVHGSTTATLPRLTNIPGGEPENPLPGH
jgi:phage gp45-like